MLKKEEVVLYLDGRTTYDRDRDIIKCSVKTHAIFYKWLYRLKIETLEKKINAFLHKMFFYVLV